ncbi:hypothetical protein A3J43_00005 [Candidatus Uhrbacteria bacterium RIFCSPHIGHO2_12_FULL_54_23]|uniref:DUF3800 domain-containing protein n=1 Tax=Candidatus Uhrbacteria bacterium RIFCSPHIGHO2_12_FULL_54_23 TaxID=1802397 RepID=A0A1F7UFW5_9BACT|nr:MAG: hypothetical protein A3J43_00005 [Candidatus Uhrbacteria bacterium RIFCSPHIGHO2_12_FULL_54_23]
MENLYCYVDETGQDTKGTLFCVCCTVVVSAAMRDQLEKILEDIEHASRKRSKWQKTDKKVRRAFLDALISHRHDLEGCVYVEHFYRIVDYTEATIEAIARSVGRSPHPGVPVVVYIDGLSKHMVNVVGVGLRRYGLMVGKVKGLKDEQSALIRLSDAVAGFVRDYLEGQDYTKKYYAELLKVGAVIEV